MRGMGGARGENTTHTLHELLASRSDIFGQSGGEHHDLFMVGCGPEDLLDVTSHICYGVISKQSKSFSKRLVSGHGILFSIIGFDAISTET